MNPVGKIHFPSPRQLALAVAAIALAALPVLLAWRLFGGNTADSMFRGMTFMLVAVTHVTLRRQLVLALSIGAAGLAGVLVAGNVAALFGVTVAACLAQAVFNRWSVGAGALLPAAVVSYSNVPSGPAWGVALAAGAGALFAMLAALAARRPVSERSASCAAARRHAVTLAIGCVILLLADQAAHLPHGGWAVLTFCLLYLPSPEQARARVRDRVLGTVAGAVAGAAIAVEAPRVVCLAIAVPLILIAVAFDLMPDEYLGYVVFFTPAIILLYGASKQGWDVVGLAGERIGLTVLAGGMAVIFTAVALRTVEPDSSARADAAKRQQEVRGEASES